MYHIKRLSACKWEAGMVILMTNVSSEWSGSAGWEGVGWWWKLWLVKRKKPQNKTACWDLKLAVGVESSLGPSNPNVSMTSISLGSNCVSLVLKSVFLGFNLFLVNKLSSEAVCKNQKSGKDMKRNLQGTWRMKWDVKYWCASGTGRLALSPYKFCVFHRSSWCVKCISPVPVS